MGQVLVSYIWHAVHSDINHPLELTAEKDRFTSAAVGYVAFKTEGLEPSQSRSRSS